MSEKVAKIGLKREPGFLYFLRESSVFRSPMKRAGGPSAAGQAQKVCDGNFKREPGFLYFLDAEGDIARAARTKKQK